MNYQEQYSIGCAVCYILAAFLDLYMIVFCLKWGVKSGVKFFVKFPLALLLAYRTLSFFVVQHNTVSGDFIVLNFVIAAMFLFAQYVEVRFRGDR